jgi:uncharacterized protein (DUF736 family)
MNKPMYDKPYEVKPNTGSLRKSEIKKRQESPDYYGSFKLDLNGLEVKGNIVEFKLSGWKSVDKSGKSYLSLKLNNYKPEEDQAPQYKAQPATQHQEQDDDIPF